jgi:hypothetical protein
MPNGEQLNYFGSYFKRFANCTDYVQHNQHFSCHKDAKHIPYNAVPIPVMPFHRNKQAVHTVHCTGSRRLRRHQPPRKYAALLSMGTHPDTHFKWAAGCITTQLKWHFIVKNAELSDQGLLGMVRRFTTV